MNEKKLISDDLQRFIDVEFERLKQEIAMAFALLKKKEEGNVHASK